MTTYTLTRRDGRVERYLFIPKTRAAGPLPKKAE